MSRLKVDCICSNRGDNVQDQSGFPDCAPMHFGHEIIVIIALIWFYKLLVRYLPSNMHKVIVFY